MPARHVLDECVVLRILTRILAYSQRYDGNEHVFPQKIKTMLSHKSLHRNEAEHTSSSIYARSDRLLLGQ